MTLRSDYQAWKEQRRKLNDAEDAGDFPTPSDWQASDDEAVNLLDQAMDRLSQPVQRRDITEVARVIREGAAHYKSNREHCAHAVNTARRYRQDYVGWDPAHFVRTCMPNDLVGTRGANVWTRAAHILDVEFNL